VDENGIIEVCDTFSLRSSQGYSGSTKWGPHLSISCPLAIKNHNDPDDYNLSCSVSATADAPSLVRCFSFNCAFKGSFYNMLYQATVARGNPPHLVALLQKIEPTEKFTLTSSFARNEKANISQVEAMKPAILPARDLDVLPEGRMERFAGSVPKYALSRGISIESCKAWGLGHDQQYKRLVFPVRRYDGKLIGLSGRDYTGEARSKYHNYAGLDKSRFLFGEHFLKKDQPIIIVEGQIDAIITWQTLQLPTVAILGEGFSQIHAKTIGAFTPPVIYLFPDNDPPGRLGAEKVEYILHGRAPMKLMVPPLDMDPGDMSTDQIKKAFAQAKSIQDRIVWE